MSLCHVWGEGPSIPAGQHASLPLEALAQVEICDMSLTSITAPSPLLIVLYIIQFMLCLDLPGLVVLCHSPNPSQVTSSTNLFLST